MRGAKNTKFFLKPWPLIGVGGNATSPPLYPRQRDPVPILQEAGWARGPVWTCAENLTTTGIRSQDRPASSQSLYRLSYPGPLVTWVVQHYFLCNFSQNKMRSVSYKAGGFKTGTVNWSTAYPRKRRFYRRGVRLQFFHGYLFFQVILIALSNFSHVIM